ncbi:MAG: hypothetical protein AMXMBFR84_47280 [Candidatus Hydrogenedentota bacterium]
MLLGEQLVVHVVFACVGIADDPVNYARDIQPILSSVCFTCHGPDGDKRKGGLRFDLMETAFEPAASGMVPLWPGQKESSEVYRRIASANAENQMPPPASKKSLTSEQVNLIGRWIDEGAQWTPHWSLRPIVLPEPPTVSMEDWARNPVDLFVLAKLESNGLSPSPEADRRTLARRLYFDLIGLPPTPEEMNAFINDPDPAAYEKLADNLLASPHYGERWGRHWLDIAHYADTHGYDKDKRRPNAWPYRDYVIRSLNNDISYSKFVAQQIAGDMIDPGDPDGAVALGFIAAGPWDFVGHVELREGTVDKNLTRLLDRDDMVATTMNVFTSTTVQCARCHDHKFDPVDQRDYYGLQAVFAGVERANRAYDQDREAGRVRHEQTRRLARLDHRSKELSHIVDALTSPELDKARQELAKSEDALRTLERGNDSPSNGYHSAVATTADTTKWVQIDLGSVESIDEVKIIPARPTDFADTPGFGFPARFCVTVANEPDFSMPVCILDESTADIPNPGDEHTIINVSGTPFRYLRVTATKLWPRNNDYVFALAEVELNKDGVNRALGKEVVAFDSIESGRWAARYLVDGYTSRNRRVKLAENDSARDKLKEEVAAKRLVRDTLVESMLTPAMAQEIKKNALDIQDAKAKLAALPSPDFVYAATNSFSPEGSFTPPSLSRSIDILRRGDLAQPIAPAQPGAVGYFHELDKHFANLDISDEGQRRLALAHWLTDRKNPLTWRSIVNRVWGYHFGKGIVDTPNDFGRMGSEPTHPELIDWLAATFRDGNQSLKELHRLLVNSATYRQTSTFRDECADVDSENRFLWRMNRKSVDAESFRDAVLLVSGKLDRTMGGPGFDLFGFEDDHSPRYKYTEHNVDDPASFRRTVYRFVVRSVPDPLMDTLDCADPSQSVPVRNHTITALQALAVMNNPFVVRMAEHLADRTEPWSSDPAARINAMYKFAFCRDATDEEGAIMQSLAKKHGWPYVSRVLFNINEFMFVD